MIPPAFPFPGQWTALPSVSPSWTWYKAVGADKPSHPLHDVTIGVCNARPDHAALFSLRSPVCLGAYAEVQAQLAALLLTQGRHQ